MTSGKGIPLPGDRSVFDALGYPELHTDDTDVSVDALHHTLGEGTGQAAAGDHTHPQGDVDLTFQHMILFTIEGFVTTGNKNLRLTNVFGKAITIEKVYLSIDTAPTGADLIVDLHKNGTTIFTNQANRPVISAGAYSGYTTSIDVSTWSDGEYLQLHVDQNGSTVMGSNLVCHILFHFH